MSFATKLSLLVVVVLASWRWPEAFEPIDLGVGFFLGWLWGLREPTSKLSEPPCPKL